MRNGKMKPTAPQLLAWVAQLAADLASPDMTGAGLHYALNALRSNWHPDDLSWITSVQFGAWPQRFREAAAGNTVTVLHGRPAREILPTRLVATVAILPCPGLGASLLSWTHRREWTADDVAAWQIWCTQVTLHAERSAHAQYLVPAQAGQVTDLMDDRLALDAFVAYKEAVGGVSDVLTLARQAEQVLRTTMPHLSAAYYELDGNLWKARVWSADLPPDLADTLQAGVPADTLNFAQAHSSQREVFVDAWNAAANHLPDASTFGAAAFLPLVVEGQVRSIFAVGTQQTIRWSEREKALIRAVTRGLRVTLERTEHLRQLEEERAALDAFVQFTETSSQVVDPRDLAVRAAAVLAVTLDVQASFLTRRGQVWIGEVFSDSVPDATRDLVQRGLPAEWPILKRPFDAGGAVFIDDWGSHPEAAVPTGLYHAVALYPYRQTSGTQGLLAIATPRRRAWTERERSVFHGVGRSLALAFERVEHNRKLAETARSLEAFMAYTEAIGTRTDVTALADHAITVLERHFPQSSVWYLERQGDVWKICAWNADFPEDLLATLQAGVTDNAVTREVLRTRGPVFVDHWDAQVVGLEQTEQFSSGVNVPLIVDGEVRGLLGIGRPDAMHWEPQEQALIRAVVRGLTLALERAAASRTLEEQNAELKARARALEALSSLTRDLSIHGDPSALMWQTQSLVLSLLPEGCALYYELRGELWRCVSQIGTLHDADLQATIDAGLPYDQTQNLVIPWTTGRPYFQDRYDHDTDGLRTLTYEVGATATLPIQVGKEIVGVFAVALRSVRQWTQVDRAVLETTVRQLGLALEGARTLQALHRTRQYLDVAVANAPMLLFAANEQGVITLFEGQLARQLTDEPQRIVGQSVTELFRQDPTLPQISSLHRALQGERIHEIIELDGRPEVLEVWFVPVHGAQDAVAEIVGVALDVTERWTAQGHLEATNSELRRSNAELEQFAYVASHDLQEPLRTVTSFTELLVHRYSPLMDERGLKYMQLITQATKRMSHLLEDLLGFSRVSQVTAEHRPVDTGVLVQGVLQDLEDIITRTGAEVRLHDLPPIRANSYQVRQVFQNLIGNALKFAAADRPMVVCVTGRRLGEQVEFTVTDTGIGIDPQYHERIFTIFQRLHNREQYAGNGIGLSISRKIVERHGGQMRVQSEQGQGSTFSFTLPAGNP